MFLSLWVWNFNLYPVDIWGDISEYTSISKRGSSYYTDSLELSFSSEFYSYSAIEDIQGFF
jgi:hypothetical protein